MDSKLVFLDQDALGLAKYLRNDFRVVRTVDFGMERASDPEILVKAVDLGAVLITHNWSDFELVHETWLRASQHDLGVLSAYRQPKPQVFATAIIDLLSEYAVRDQMLIWERGSGDWFSVDVKD